MQVVKRDGRREPVSFDKILDRIQKLTHGLTDVDPVVVAQRVVSYVKDDIHTSELDVLAAETAAGLVSHHPDYATLAGRICLSNLQKETPGTFSSRVKTLYEYVNPKTEEHSPLLAEEFYQYVMDNADALDAMPDYSKDFQYFGFKTMERSYLLQAGPVMERPQDMLLRVSVAIHMGDLDAIRHSYELMRDKKFTHASPTLFNAGTPNGQLSSCFLTGIKEDSIDGIYETVQDCAMISKGAGGIGFSISNVRAYGSYIRGTNGTSNGLVPMLRVFNNTARYVDQGGGKRKGAFAAYLEPWHADVEKFLDLRKNHGKEEDRARDLFLALWVNDLFMQRVQDDKQWSLFCPNECPGLVEAYGSDFKELYEKYEFEGRARKTVKARNLFTRILDAQIETGTPYMLFKDAVNLKSNQMNLGTINCSNLCTEVVQYSSPKETAVCTLASVALNMFVTEDGYDFNALYEVVKTMTRNLDKVIDVNHYPIESARTSNMRHRPMGIGVQGLADAFVLLGLPYDSEEARQLNRDIFETIYFASLTASCELAQEKGTYESYEGSPISKGILQFDMWDVMPSTRWDWDALRAKIAEHGVRNSLLVAPMPTASTASILGNNEAFEPFTSVLYVRRTLAGEFTIINKHLVRELQKRDLWNEEMRNDIIRNKGSVQAIASMPDDLKLLFRTSFEIPGRMQILMAGDRAPFVDQSMSLNLHIQDVTLAKLSSAHFMTWRLGLKTGLYYLRTKAAADPIQFTCTSCSA